MKEKDGFCCFSGIIFALIFLNCQALPDKISIGALLDTDNAALEEIFRVAVNKINENSHILPRTRVKATVAWTVKDDSYNASKQVCQLLKNSQAGIFGPHSSPNAPFVRSLCNAVGIPYMEQIWTDGSRDQGLTTVNLYPTSNKVCGAFLDLIKHLQWKTFALIYTKQEGLSYLERLLETTTADAKVKVVVYNLDFKSKSMDLLKTVKATGETRVVFHSDGDEIYDFFKLAQQVGMVNQYYSYIVTHLDLSLKNLEVFRDTDVKICGVRLVDPTKPEVLSIINKDTLPISAMTTDTALLYDSTLLFAKALHDLSRRQDLNTISISCDQGNVWSFGPDIIGYMKHTEVDGLTGVIQLDSKGYRSEFQLEVVHLTKNGIEKAGKWSVKSGIDVKGELGPNDETKPPEKDKTLVITTILSRPYIMLKSNSSQSQAGVNSKYEGFLVDLIDIIANELQFRYTIQIVKDGMYGAMDENGQWSGMVGEIVRREADMALADLTIVSSRKGVMDFTVPILTSGIGILYRKPPRIDRSVFFFLQPFTKEVWLFVIAAFVVVSVLLFVLARLNAAEWGKDEHYLEQNQVNYFHSLWFIFAAFTQQGTSAQPRATSTRILSLVWWMFVLIFLSSYLANLAAMFVKEIELDTKLRLSSVDDLARQTKVKYGTLIGGSTNAFFKTSQINTFQRMWQFMSAQKPSVFVKTYAEGIEKVQTENYAFLMETTSLEYLTRKDCSLMQIGGMLNYRGYGIGLPAGSPYRRGLSTVILHLQEKGVIHKLREKWWNPTGAPISKCAEFDPANFTAAEINFADFYGVLIFLCCGVFLSFIAAIIELFWKARITARAEGGSIFSAVNREIKYAFTDPSIHCNTETRQRLEEGIMLQGNDTLQMLE